MSYIKINQEKAADPEALAGICPFGAIEVKDGRLEIHAGCRMCRMCVKKGGGVFEFVEENAAPAVDKSLWRGVAVVAEINADGVLHPVALELLGKARELASKTGQKVTALVAGCGTDAAVGGILEHGADEVHVYDAPELKHFRIEPYVNVLEDFINATHPSAVLVGGTENGRSLAPRAAARFRTGLTADCTSLDMSPDTDLDQIRPAYGGNIMAHINTPRTRPQFATVRYKVFSVPPKETPHGGIVRHVLAADKLASSIEIIERKIKDSVKGIEEAETLVVCGRGVKNASDVAMLEELASLLGGKTASTRPMVEAGWFDANRQIGLSGRTVKPKLLIACGVSGAIQFASGMNNSECIVAINTDPDAPIFGIADIGIVGDLYKVVPELIAVVKAKKSAVEE